MRSLSTNCDRPEETALPALISRLCDELRVWDGQRPTEEWKNLMGTAIGKVTRQEAREFVV
ncbi:MAG: hypothetical protein KKI02_09860, partial [Planctomycetes bacterium]|nr:hypothetical protein [Planctomycetota bacterium]